jgi:hypothetical protein
MRRSSHVNAAWQVVVAGAHVSPPVQVFPVPHAQPTTSVEQARQVDMLSQ